MQWNIFSLVGVAAAALLSRSFAGLSPATEAWTTVQLNPLPCECELKMKLRLSDINTHALEDYKVKASDRNYLPIAIGMGKKPFEY